MTIGEADVHRRRFLTASAYSMAATVLPLGYVKEMAERTAAARGGAVIGAAEVSAVRDMVGLFAEMDERRGGQHGRAAFVQYLITDIAPLCQARFHNDDLRRQMLSVASSAAHLAGWEAYDSGEQGLAQWYYMQSFALALESGEPGQDGFVMRTMSQQGMKLHRPEHCLDLAASGLARAHDQVPAPARALFHITHAHTLAETSQRRQAVAEIEAARTALDTGRGDQVPFWALAWGPPEATVVSRTAKVLERRSSACQPVLRPRRRLPPGWYLRSHRRPGSGRRRRIPTQTGQHRRGMHHLEPGDGPHGRRGLRPHPQGGTEHTPQPSPLPQPRAAMRCRPR